jgi:hypothetical protein
MVGIVHDVSDFVGFLPLTALLQFMSVGAEQFPRAVIAITSSVVGYSKTAVICQNSGSTFRAFLLNASLRVLPNHSSKMRMPASAKIKRN